MAVAEKEQLETFEFQAEVQQLLKLVINSLYSDKDIFLRELVSNASDAHDRLRLESLTRPEIAMEGEPEIRVVPDERARTLTIRDNGIGMSRQEVIANIGTIAKSGTAEMLRSLKEKPTGEGAAQLIGQFGVGFYSSFMVADRVELVTRRAGEETATHWESTGDGSYTLSDAERPEGHGTTITLHLKPVDRDNGIDDYAERWTLTRIIKQHCDFITYPIVLVAEKDVDVTEAGQEAPEAEAREIEEKVLNSRLPIWARSPSEVKEEEYRDYYKSISHDWTEPFETIHQRGEGTIEYQALLFIPSKAPRDLFYVGAKPGLKLYVKRVLVMESCEDLLPRYLRFVRGVVDSPDLPLNVSRETLQDDRNIRKIRQALVKKTLGVLTAMQEGSRERYTEFWGQFGRAIKEGVGQDYEQRDALNKLLMFESSRDPEALTTLGEYVARMPEEQQAIYYLTGPSRSVIENNPSLEMFRDRGFEVLYLSDPVDELVTQSLWDFEGKKLKSVGKGVVDLGGEAENKDDKTGEEEAYKPLLEALEKKLETWVKVVRLSGRLSRSPAVLVGAEHDYSPHLERMLATGINDAPKQRRIMELNPKHEVVQKLKTRFDANPEDPAVAEYAEILFGWGLIAEGSPLHDPVRFNQLVAELMTRGL
jgi:molecular chaperone HtpG